MSPALWITGIWIFGAVVVWAFAYGATKGEYSHEDYRNDSDIRSVDRQVGYHTDGSDADGFIYAGGRDCLPCPIAGSTGTEADARMAERRMHVETGAMRESFRRMSVRLTKKAHRIEDRARRGRLWI